jgi:predicted nucleic acid-binding protein
MSLYLDASCLLKLLLAEPESPRVRELLAKESDICVCSLAVLEAQSVLLAMKLGGEISPRLHVRLVSGLAEMLAQAPFIVIPLAPTAAEAALRQLSAGPYCRTLDRLHLAGR